MPNQHKIQRVLPLLLQLEKNKDDYFPEAVSLWPYHHGEPKLAFVEAFKPKAVNLLVAGGREKKEAYYDKVVSIIGDIRNCYEEANYSDADLAQMMLRDASLIIIYMEVSASDTQSPDARTLKKVLTMRRHLGMLTFEILSRDLNLLQNQIPLRVIKLLIGLRYEAGEGKDLIDRFIYKGHFGMYRQEGECNLQQGEEPLHLLEAVHRVLTSVEKSKRCGAAAAASPTGVEKERDPETGGGAPLVANGLLIRLRNILSRKKAASQPKNNIIRKSIPKFRAATDLKAKGIYFRPSPSYSLKDVSFKPCLFNAWLELPVCGVSTRSKVFYKNMVAYELSPNSAAKGEISSYIYFMNSLIEEPEDVKELREREILYNMLGSDVEVLNVFKDINTHGAGNSGMFQQVRDQINAHSNSRMKTWMAELIHTNFKSPWTASAFLAALALLAISVAQLYYAAHPP